MSDVVITSGKPSGTTTAVEGTEALVDPTFGSVRVSTRPLEFAANGRVMGHYSLALATPNTSGIAAAGGLFSFRWADSSSLCVIYRVEINASLITVFTGAQPIDCDLVVVRAFTVSDTGGTSVLPSGQFAKMRTGVMTSTLLADARITSGTALTNSGGSTVDAQAIGIAAFPGNSLGTTGTPTDLLQTTANGEHPLILGANEGFRIRVVTAQGAAGVAKYYIRVNWAEVPGF